MVVDDHGYVDAHVQPTLVALVAEAEHRLGGLLDAVGIDIPIGLLDAPRRSADVAARAYVGPRRSSVFAAPHPSVIDAVSQADANQRLAAQHLPLLSSQSVALLPRIREAGRLAAGDRRVIEVFPEATFRHLAGDAIQGYKKSWGGTVQRIGLLAAADPPVVVPWDLGEAGRVAVDDVFDAAAVAWSAHRYAHSRAVPLGDPDEIDPATGRRIAVWV